MSFTATTFSPPSSSFQHLHRTKLHYFGSNIKFTVQFRHLKSPFSRFLLPIQASRRVSNSSAFPSSSDLGSRNWSPSISSEFLDHELDHDDDDVEEEEEEEDRSLDLLIRFVENVFKKVSKRARKAVRSVLPVSISPKLVRFAVNGLLILALLWACKALLEVICTLGSVVFVSILLIRVIWSAVTYLQETRYLKMNGLDDDHQAWTGVQPAT